MPSDLSDIPFDDFLGDFSDEEGDEVILLEAGSADDDGSLIESADGIGIGDASFESPARKLTSAFGYDDDLEWLAGSAGHDSESEQSSLASAEPQSESLEQQTLKPELRNLHLLYLYRSSKTNSRRSRSNSVAWV